MDPYNRGARLPVPEPMFGEVGASLMRATDRSKVLQAVGLMLAGHIATAQAGHFPRPFEPVAVVERAPANAQSQAVQQPTFRTEANYVRVDVYPTRDGVAVADLRRDDFEVLENGVVQSIDAFEHVIIQRVGQDQRGREPSTVAE